MGKNKSSNVDCSSDYIYWLRVALAVAAALICVVGRLSIEGIIVGSLLYLLSFLIIIRGLNIRTESNNISFYTLGLGSYIAIWFVLWILLNTFLSSV